MRCEVRGRKKSRLRPPKLTGGRRRCASQVIADRREAEAGHRGRKSAERRGRSTEHRAQSAEEGRAQGSERRGRSTEHRAQSAGEGRAQSSEHRLCPPKLTGGRRKVGFCSDGRQEGKRGWARGRRGGSNNWICDFDL